jgi:hypothetical protein
VVTLLVAVAVATSTAVRLPKSPDPAKNHRDRAVSEIASAVIEDVFDLLLERPSHRLAVYGTLAPGEPNEAVLADIHGEWTDGTVRGEITRNKGPYWSNHLVGAGPETQTRTEAVPAAWGSAAFLIGLAAGDFCEKREAPAQAECFSSVLDNRAATLETRRGLP